MAAQDTELCFYETTLEPALEKVAALDAEIGLAVVNDTQLPVFLKMAAGKNVCVTPLDDPRPMYVHVRRDHPLAKADGLECRRSFEYPRVLLPGDFFSHLNQTLLDDLRRPSEWPRRTITVNSYHSVLRMLRSTNGYIVGNAWQREELQCSQTVSYTHLPRPFAGRGFQTVPFPAGPPVLSARRPRPADAPPPERSR